MAVTSSISVLLIRYRSLRHSSPSCLRANRCEFNYVESQDCDTSNSGTGQFITCSPFNSFTCLVFHPLPFLLPITIFSYSFPNLLYPMGPFPTSAVELVEQDSPARIDENTVAERQVLHITAGKIIYIRLKPILNLKHFCSVVCMYKITVLAFSLQI